jgi:hypothetical protein
MSCSQKKKSTSIKNSLSSIGEHEIYSFKFQRHLESFQTGFTSRCGITRVALRIFATATASHIYRIGIKSWLI